MVFLSAPALQFSAVLVGLSVIALIVLMRPGLPGDRAALRWWVAGDIALVVPGLATLLQPAFLWPSYSSDGGLQAANIPTLSGLFVILGLGCHVKALFRLCHGRLSANATVALLAVLPVGVAATIHILSPASRPLPIFAGVVGLTLAQMWISWRARAGSRALRIMAGANAVLFLLAVQFIVGTLTGSIPPPPPTGPGAPPYMPPLPAIIGDFVGSITFTFLFCMALQERQQSYVTRLSTTDQLTGAVNRRGMLPLLDQALRRGEREPFSVAVLDIDHFKRVNDQYGHEAGDAVLVGFADAVTALCRAGDVLGRWGGEEFLLLMPNTGAASARAAVQRIQAQLSDHLAGRVPCIVTFSAGIATVRDHAPGGIDSLIARADKVLYAAKVSRNCVVSDGLEPAEAPVAGLAAAG
jgi:diguanylate cyclase (GGDEF)-like protein